MQTASIKATNPVNPISLIATHPVIPHSPQTERPDLRNRPDTLGTIRTPAAPRGDPEVSRPRLLFHTRSWVGEGVKTTLSPIEHNC